MWEPNPNPNPNPSPHIEGARQDVGAHETELRRGSTLQHRTNIEPT